MSEDFVRGSRNNAVNELTANGNSSLRSSSSSSSVSSSSFRVRRSRTGRARSPGRVAGSSSAVSSFREKKTKAADSEEEEGGFALHFLFSVWGGEGRFFPFFFLPDTIY